MFDDRVERLSLRSVWLAIWVVIAGLGHAFVEPGRNRPEPAPEGPAFPGAPGGRTVVVIVDSLRAETAEDPARMPWMAEARARGTWGRMEPCANRFTIPCVRLMFEGYEPPFAVGLQDFTPVPVDGPSLFRRLRARGVGIGVIGDHSVPGLYGHLADRAVNDEEAPVPVDRQDEWAVRQFLRWLDDDSLSFLVLHLIHTDSISHAFHPGTPEYDAVYRETDGWLREIAARLGPRGHMIVLGDHGHDELGMHIPGLDVPAAYVAIGPTYARGVRRDLGLASLYLLAGAPYGFDLPPGYEGQAPVTLLHPGGPALAYARFLAARMGLPPDPATDADLGRIERRLEDHIVSLRRSWLDDFPTAFATLLPWALGVLLALASGALRRRWLAVAAAGWASAVALPTFAAGWGALALHVALLAWRDRLPSWRPQAAILATGAFAFALGATGSRLVPFFHVGSVVQVHHNLAFAALCLLGTALLALLLRRSVERHVWWRVVVPFALLAELLLFGYMGPYYYGAGSLVPWALAVAPAVLAARGRGSARERAALAAVALLAPGLTIWHHTWALVWHYTLIAEIGNGPLGSPALAWTVPLLLHLVSRAMAGDRPLRLDAAGPLLLAAGSGALALALAGAPQWGVAGAAAATALLSLFVGTPADRAAARLAAFAALATGFFLFPYGAALAFVALALAADALARLAAGALDDAPRARALVLAALGAALAFVTAWVAVPAYRMGSIDFTFAWTVIWNSPVQALRALQVLLLSLVKYFGCIAAPAAYVLARCPDRKAARALVLGGMAVLLFKVFLQVAYLCGDLLDPSARYRITVVQELMCTTGAALAWSFAWAIHRLRARPDTDRALSSAAGPGPEKVPREPLPAAAPRGTAGGTDRSGG